MTAARCPRCPARAAGGGTWLAALLLAALLLATACRGGAAEPDAINRAPEAQPRGAVHVQATWTSYQLPAAISGEVAVTRGGQILIGGGTSLRGAPLGTIVRLDPVTGQIRPAGKLSQPVTDAGAAFLHGRLVVFGGRAIRTTAVTQATGPGLMTSATGARPRVPASASTAPASASTVPGGTGRVQARTRVAVAQVLGRLPQARSGMAAVTAGQAVYLVGGVSGTGATALATVLRTTDGVHYSVAATLPVAVSYPGVVVQAGQLWVFGGRTSASPATAGPATAGPATAGPATAGPATVGLTDAIQQVDLSTGRSRIAGRLPRPLAAESAFILHGQVFLAGGETPAPAKPGGPGQRPAGPSRVAPRVSVSGPHGTHAVAQAGSGPAAAGVATSAAVLRYAPASGTVSVAGQLPLPTAHAASAVVHDVAYLIGGTDGPHAMPAVVALRLLGAAKAGAPITPGWVTPQGGPAQPGAATGSMPWLTPVRGKGHLAPGSHPWALPADVLIADHLNNRLVIVDPQGRIRWVFPRPGDLARGQTFLVPDDAFFSADGRYIVATQEDDQVISVINVTTRKIVYRYGKPGTPGMGRNRLHNPDDAMLLPGGDIVAADIMNCRVLLISPPAHRPRRVFGQSTSICVHDPPHRFGSPNGAFPMAGGGYVVTEINGDWADGLSRRGRLLWSANPPGVSYPSDTNQVSPGRYLTADYSDPGQVVEFSRTGRLLWRFGGLNQPSLALPMPNGYVVLNDDFNHRVIVVNPANNHILWQYGHTGVPGRAPGYLDDPDGLDLVPPDSFLARQAATSGRP